MNRIFFVFIFISSFVIRAIYAYYSWYIRDQARVFDLGYKIYKYHILPIQGSPVVYTNSLLPGSLQAILASIPLYFSGGHPYSIILFVQLLNLFACLIIYNIYRNLFHTINKYFMFSFIILNPMNIIYSYGWNPSFIIIFSSLYFLGIAKLCQNKNSKLGLFLALFPHLLILQLNLQFLILVILTIVLLIRKIIPVPSFKMLILSALPGIITLSPMIVEKLFYKRGVDANWNLNGNLFDNVKLHFENIFSYFHIVARFLSFATGETTRNLGEGFIKHHPQIWLFFLIGMIGTAFIFFMSIFFYLDKSKWRVFFKDIASLSALEMLDCVLIYLPIIATILFVFSVTPPTTHKIWSLFPFCFYPFFRVLSQASVINFHNTQLHVRGSWLKNNYSKLYQNRFKLFSVYVLSTLIYSTIGGTYIPTSFSEIFHESKNFCLLNKEEKLTKYLSLTDYSTKEYTMALMCEYWQQEHK